jgi:hypothetical protein
VAYFLLLSTVFAFSTPSLARALLSARLRFFARLQSEETSLIFGLLRWFEFGVPHSMLVALPLVDPTTRAEALRRGWLLCS